MVTGVPQTVNKETNVNYETMKIYPTGLPSGLDIGTASVFIVGVSYFRTSKPSIQLEMFTLHDKRKGLVCIWLEHFSNPLTFTLVVRLTPTQNRQSR